MSDSHLCARNPILIGSHRGREESPRNATPAAAVADDGDANSSFGRRQRRPNPAALPKMFILIARIREIHSDRFYLQFRRKLNKHFVSPIVIPRKLAILCIQEY